MKRLFLIFIIIPLVFTLCKNKNIKTINFQTNENKQVKELYDSVDSVDNQIFLSVIETMPEFPGGQKALISFIINNTNYPQSAIDFPLHP